MSEIRHSPNQVSHVHERCSQPLGKDLHWCVTEATPSQRWRMASVSAFTCHYEKKESTSVQDREPGCPPYTSFAKPDRVSSL